MKPKVFITIDTEEDGWCDYRPCGNRAENTRRIPEIQALFDRYGAIPTYLINFPVATSDIAKGVLLPIMQSERCEIGAHVHPWNTPPFEEEINGRNSMLCNLPYRLQGKKLGSLHKVIGEQFGVVPLSFRAGRWGFSGGVARCLRKLGYHVDSSITPFVDWRKWGGPDFSEASTFPYRFDPDDILIETSDGFLVEVPATIGFYQKHMKMAYGIRKALQNGCFRGLRILGMIDFLGLSNLRWLSPEFSTGREMVRLAKNFVRLGHPHLNMTFHSTSLMAGKSPFVRTDEDLRRFYSRIETFLKFCVEQRLTFAPLSEAAVLF